MKQQGMCRLWLSRKQTVKQIWNCLRHWEVDAGSSEAGTETLETNTETQTQGYTFTDDLGREVTVKSADRVATLIGSFTDVWMLAGGNVVAAANDSWESLGFRP